ncbi:MAG: hypothetical protein C7B46_15180 [Sulfobacillus benefaciens]|uniref:Pyruvate phosphate dikinase AMP/ATP-binding domain-containing protein n=1 Tax=Sulfobacillus benefaciens TaxID=453960 RepID=A0A2T2XCR1_9FIRM|nr:MAG: hypothetical protein C7B46_15180 [Sulfobacillus benefaciens]
MYTVSLHNGSQYPNLVGAKALSLAALNRLHIAVPQGFVITTLGHKHYLDHNNVDILEEDASTKIREGIFPIDLRNRIIASYDALGPTASVAVRSSGTLEDLDDASFAGQYETILDVSSDRLLEAVAACWESMCSSHLTVYMRHRGYSPDQCLMAVIVQKMVNADIAGVCFTAHPITGKDEIVVNANWGLGESVVSGSVIPDTFIIAKDTGTLVLQEMGDKEQMVKPKAEGGVEHLDTPISMRHRFCLNQVQIQQLVDASKNIEQQFGSPVDVEFAFENSTLYILQARPITGKRGSIVQ